MRKRGIFVFVLLVLVSSVYAEDRFNVGENCKEVFPGFNGDVNERINLVFLPTLYSNLDTFLGKIRYLVNKDDNSNSFFSIEPLKSNKNKFNFWYVDKNIQTDFPLIYGLECNIPSNIKVVVSVGNKQNIYNANPAVQIITLPNAADPIHLVHEFLHAFGGHVDEYGGDGSLITNPSIINCDSATSEMACPKWCKGPPISIDKLKMEKCSQLDIQSCLNVMIKGSACFLVQGEGKLGKTNSCINIIDFCTSIKDQTSCDDTRNNFYQGRVCSWVSKIYTDKEHPYYKSHCLPPIDKINIGTQCVADTGCFNGCAMGRGIFRSEKRGILQETSGGLPLGIYNEKLLCDKIRDLTGSVGGRCNEVFALYNKWQEVEIVSDSNLIGDFNSDNCVKFDDFLLFAKAFSEYNEKGIFNDNFDLNEDGKIDIADFLIFVGNFNPNYKRGGLTKPVALTKPAGLIGDLNRDGCVDEKDKSFALFEEQPNNACKADFDDDGIVGVTDFAGFKEAYNSKEGDENWNSKFDLDGSGIVDFPDFLEFDRDFGNECVADGGEVPEECTDSDGLDYKVKGTTTGILDGVYRSMNNPIEDICMETSAATEWKPEPVEFCEGNEIDITSPQISTGNMDVMVGTGTKLCNVFDFVCKPGSNEIDQAFNLCDKCVEGVCLKEFPYPARRSTKPTGSVKCADFDGDGEVAFSDFLLFTRNFGARAADENWNDVFDIDSDGQVGFGDFLQLSRAFGSECSRETAAELDVEAKNNQKNKELYHNKQVFLVSDKNWQDVLQLVPLTTWTVPEGHPDMEWCDVLKNENGTVRVFNEFDKEGNPVTNYVCGYPLLVYHEEATKNIGDKLNFHILYKNSEVEITEPNILLTKYSKSESGFDFLKQVYPDNGVWPVSFEIIEETKEKISIKLKIINLGKVSAKFEAFEIVGHYPYNLEKKMDTILFEPGETEVPIEFLKNSGNYDIDSIIEFLDQYVPSNIILAESTDENQEINRIFASGIVEKMGDVMHLEKSGLYDLIFKHGGFFDSIDTVVISDDDYGTALLASQYASYINAPLVIMDDNFENIKRLLDQRRLICIGNILLEGCTNYDLDGLRMEYRMLTKTNRFILTNPQDLNIFSEFMVYPVNTGGVINEINKGISLFASVLASSKHELIFFTKGSFAEEIYENFKADLDKVYPLSERKSHLSMQRSEFLNYIVLEEEDGGSKVLYPSKSIYHILSSGDKLIFTESLDASVITQPFSIVLYDLKTGRKGVIGFLSQAAVGGIVVEGDYAVWKNDKRGISFYNFETQENGEISLDSDILTDILMVGMDPFSKFLDVKGNMLSVSALGKNGESIVVLYDLRTKEKQSIVFPSLKKIFDVYAGEDGKVYLTADIPSSRSRIYYFYDIETSEQGILDNLDLDNKGIEINPKDPSFERVSESSPYTLLEKGGIVYLAKRKAGFYEQKSYGYLTILGSSLAIPLREFMALDSGSLIYRALDTTLYADVEREDNNPDLSVGRIFGFTSSDVSSLLARIIFYDTSRKTNNVKFFASSEDVTIIDDVDVFRDIFLDAGYNAQSFKNPKPSFQFDESEWKNQDMIYYEDHGLENWAGIYAHQIPPLRNSLLFISSCLSCSTNDKDSFCHNAFKKGAISYLGAVSVARTIEPADKNPNSGNYLKNKVKKDRGRTEMVHRNMIKNVYKNGYSLGDAFLLSFEYNPSISMNTFFGDPTFYADSKLLSGDFYEN